MEQYIRTVCGDIDVTQIKSVLVHEHIIWDIIQPNKNQIKTPIEYNNRWQTNYETNLNAENSFQNNINIATEELNILKSYGGDLIVDQSTHGIGRDPLSLYKISKNTKMNIVAAAGTYCSNYLKNEIKSLNIDQLVDRFTSEIETGIEQTNIKAGIIGEIGCSDSLDNFEKNALIAAAKTHKITGAAISVHPGKKPESPFRLINILENERVDISKVAICHIDRTYPNGNRVEELLRKGVFVEWDFFGIENSHLWLKDIELPIDRDRIKLIKKMFKLGFGNKILISQDICSKTGLHKWGGHGYEHIFKNVIPLMKDYGMNNEQIDQLIRINPINFLSIKNNK